MSEFFAMGGYAAYVWPAFAIVLGSMAGLLIVSWRDGRRTAKTLEALQAERRSAREAA
ncbi:MAG: heme exporter protein CcmD [Alphaproteobacteria bacterium]